MENEILSAIVEVEREIRARLAREGRRAAELLEGLKLELETERAREEERLATSLRQRVAAAREEARERGDALLRDAEQQASRLDRLPDEFLARCIGNHLGAIARGRQR